MQFTKKLPTEFPVGDGEAPRDIIEGVTNLTEPVVSSYDPAFDRAVLQTLNALDRQALLARMLSGADKKRALVAFLSRTSNPLNRNKSPHWVAPLRANEVTEEAMNATVTDARTAAPPVAPRAAAGGIPRS